MCFIPAGVLGGLWDWIILNIFFRVVLSIELLSIKYWRVSTLVFWASRRGKLKWRFMDVIGVLDQLLSRHTFFYTVMCILSLSDVHSL
jgi:hypothetical protein